MIKLSLQTRLFCVFNKEARYGSVCGGSIKTEQRIFYTRI